MWSLQELRNGVWIEVNRVDSQFVASLWRDETRHNPLPRRYVQV